MRWLWMLVAWASAAQAAPTLTSTTITGSGAAGDTTKINIVVNADATDSLMIHGVLETTVQTVNGDEFALTAETWYPAILDGSRVKMDITADANDDTLAIGQRNNFKPGQRLFLERASDGAYEILALMDTMERGAVDSLRVLRAQEGTSVAAFHRDSTNVRIMTFIGPNDSKTIKAWFRPYQGGVYIDSFGVVVQPKGGAKDTLWATVTATCHGPRPVWPGRVDFGRVAVGDTVTTKVVIENAPNGVSPPNSADSLIITDFSFLHPHFFTSKTALRIGPSKVDTLDISFAPTAAEPYWSNVGMSADEDTLTWGVHHRTFPQTRGLGMITLAGEGATVGTPPGIIQHLTNHSVVLDWSQVPTWSGATAVRVYYGPSPAAANTALPGRYTHRTYSSSPPKRHTIDSLLVAHVEVEADLAGGTTARQHLFVRSLSGKGGLRDRPVNMANPITGLYGVSDSILAVQVTHDRAHVSPYRLMPDVKDDVEGKGSGQAPGGNVDKHDSGIWRNMNLWGADWQAGPWYVIRGNGTGDTLTVSATYRRNEPQNMEYATVQGNYVTGGRGGGPGTGWADAKHMLVDDEYIYIKTDTTVGKTADMFLIEGPHGVVARAAWNPDHNWLLSAQVNQAGYLTWADSADVTFSHWMGDGGAFRAADLPDSVSLVRLDARGLLAPEVLRSRIEPTLVSASDAFVMSAVSRVNVSEALASETDLYALKWPGVGITWPFQRSKKAQNRTAWLWFKALQAQEWGRIFDSSTTSLPARPTPYNIVHATPRTTYLWGNPDSYFSSNDSLNGIGQTGKQTGSYAQAYANATYNDTVIGAHRDAGDNDFPGAVYIRQYFLMGAAYEVAGASYFSDNQLPLSHSRKTNGIPDALDLYLWGVNGFRDLQVTPTNYVRYGQAVADTGCVRPGFNASRQTAIPTFSDRDQINNAPEFISDPTNPNYQRLQYYTWGCDGRASLEGAALFAQAARLVRPANSDTSDMLIRRARMAYTYATNVAGIDSMKGGIRLKALGELYRFYSTFPSADTNGDSTAFAAAWDTTFRVLQDSLGGGNFWKGAVIDLPGTKNYGKWIWNETTGKPRPADITGYIMRQSTSHPHWVSMDSMMTALNRTALSNWQVKFAHRTFGNEGYGQFTGPLVLAPGFVPHLMMENKVSGTISADSLALMKNALAQSYDHILGANPVGVSMTLGYGPRSSQAMLHSDWGAYYITYGAPRNMFGLTSYGIGSGITEEYSRMILYPDVKLFTGIGQRWINSSEHVGLTEFTVNEVNIPQYEMLMLMAFYDRQAGTSTYAPSASWQVGRGEEFYPIISSASVGTETQPEPPAAPDDNPWFDWFDWFHWF